MRVLFGRFLSLRISLRRLFVYLSVICVVSGAIAQYPDAVVAVARLAIFTTLLVGPSLLVCTSYATHSSNPRLTFFVAASGVCMGVFLSPGLSANLEPIALWALGKPWRWNGPQNVGIIDLTIPPLAALLVGVIGWWVSHIANSSHDD